MSGGTDNHLMLVDLRPFGVTGKVAQEALDRAGITCNKNAIPNDPEKPFVTSGLRLGTASCTTAGMGPERDARDRVADRRRCCARSTTTGVAAEVREQANRLCSKFTPYPEARDADVTDAVSERSAMGVRGRPGGRARRRRCC